MVENKLGLISNIQHYSTKDGPGIRTTVFMKGCNLNCQWCSNPETISFKQDIFFDRGRCEKCLECTKHYPKIAKLVNDEIVINRSKIENPEEFADVCPYSAFKVIGEYYTAKDLAKVLIKDLEFYQESNGGITFSGGEPLLQSDFIIEVIKELSKLNINVAVDTTLNISSKKLKEIIPYIDMFLVDIKFIDEDSHKQYTDVSNKQILTNLKIIAEYQSLVEARLIVIKNVNDHDIKERIDLLHNLNINLSSIHLLAYHQLGMGKYKQLEKEFIPFEVENFDFTNIIEYGNTLGHRIIVG